jgi:hypothetical protein
MRSLFTAGLTVGLCATLLAGSPADHGPTRAMAEVRLAASQGATLLTLEGGLIGIQHIFHFTPRQLQGSLCTSPNVCTPVDYPAWPLGQYFNDQGADRLIDAINAQPADGPPIVAFGHSQGGQVIYTAVRRWLADPANAPDPANVSWVSIGNPENAFGGVKKQDGLPPNTPYKGIEVIKEYDGWADAPSGPFNLLSWLNAQVGRSTTHVWGYFDVDLNSPDNTYYRPTDINGNPGNITYVFVPNDTLPLIEMTGILAPLLNPILDPILRPIVDAGYSRPDWPVVPGPVQVSAASATVNVSASRRAPSASAAAQAPTVSTVPQSVRAVAAQPALQIRSRRGAAAERTAVTAARTPSPAASRPAAAQRINGTDTVRRANGTDTVRRAEESGTA